MSKKLDQAGLGQVLLSLQQSAVALAQQSGAVMLLCGIYDEQADTWKAYKYDENGEPTSIEIPLHMILRTGGKPTPATPLIATTINGKVIAIPITCSGNGSGGGGGDHFPGLWWLLHR